MILDLINNVASKYPNEQSTQEKVTVRWFSGEIDRYYFDFNLNLKQWQQYDTEQDAHYFGVWVNMATKQILTYAEGDIILVTCLGRDTFKKELESMESFYGEAPPAATVIQGNKIINVFDRRPSG